MADPGQLNALLRLVDDPSRTVREAVAKELAGFGEELETELRSLTQVDEERIVRALELVEHFQSAAPPLPDLSGEDPPPPDASELPSEEDLAAPEDPGALLGSFEDMEAAEEEGEECGPKKLPRYFLGQLVRHKRYGYRGVVVEADPRCMADESWYAGNRTQPSRRQPWYHVLVHDSQHVTYAAESNLLPDEGMKAVKNPLVPYFFRSFSRSEGRYERNDRPWPGWPG